MKNNTRWTPDATQQEVIEATGGFHLVLAPPGCGKTQILAERIRQAHGQRGIDYADMLCLTFTNRAARGMLDRVRQELGEQDFTGLYIGNVHRYCSKFLFENGLVPAGSSVIDDDDAVSILATYLNEEEDKVKDDFYRRRSYSEMVFFSHLMYQIAHGHPRQLRLHPESMTPNDIQALRYIFNTERREFTPEALLDVYDHNDTYQDATVTDAYTWDMQQLIRPLLSKMRYAHAYTAYKRQNRLLDFEDLLLLTYDALREGSYKRYHWIQVDEVQDLNPLQLAIVDLLTAEHDASVMYLGDEQQAIFSFMGAKVETLAKLKERCQGHLHHLGVNHRSPGYLLKVFNTYATAELHIAPELLPAPDSDDTGTGQELQLLYADTLEDEYGEVARQVSSLYSSYPTDTTAVIVTSNSDAEVMSRHLLDCGIPHFKVSGLDLFATAEVKLLLAHLNVVANDANFMAWARLLHGLRVFQTAAAARSFVRNVFLHGLFPSDFLRYDNSSYLREFVAHWQQDEMVVFDTETTGLNVFEDDIVQIAAVKVRQGQVVKGSELSLFIETDRDIPARLGDVDNPILEERRHHRLLSHAEALRQFMDYAAGYVLIGHNVEYDWHILDYNLRRYLPEVHLADSHPLYFDTLRLMRMLQPNLKEYKLKYILEALHLAGSNSHLADEDVNATCSVAVYCYGQAVKILPAQSEFMAQSNVQTHIGMLRRKYGDLYRHALSILYLRDFQTKEPVLISEMRNFCAQLVEQGDLRPIEKLDYILEYLWHDLLDPEKEPSLLEQLQGHIMEINTLKEADLCGSATIRDRVFVTTVHKAKGLEFDNVIVFDAVEGRYPNYYSQNDPRQVEEDKRKFYVAISRARKRLFVAQSMTRVDYRGGLHRRVLTPFMNSILHFFSTGANQV